MGSSSQENLPSHQKKVTEELIRGREMANQLQVMLTKHLNNDGSVSAQDLAEKILKSFTQTLSILSSCEFHEVSQVPPNPLSWGSWKSEDSGESSKTSALKHQRGGCRKRKTPYILTRITPNLIDDGYAWRKYGQKTILNANHQRNYYRCTHKFDQECQATKQVQRTEDDPSMYRTTYYGDHTCTSKNLLKSPHIIFDSTQDQDSSILFSFETNNSIKKIDAPLFFPSIKQEYKPDLPTFINHNQSSPSDLLSHDQTTFNSSVSKTGVSNSCTKSSHNFKGDVGIWGI